jgi:hypothetical protein
MKVMSEPQRLKTGINVVLCKKCGGRCYAKSCTDSITYYYCVAKCGAAGVKVVRPKAVG